MPFDMPKLAGGTRVARFDARGGGGGRWTNERTGQGMGQSRTAWTTYDQPTPLDRGQIDALLRYNALARRIALRETFDATREGFELGDSPDQLALARYARKRGILRWVRRARGWARAYGGGGIYVLIDDGRPASEPVDYGNIQAVRGARQLTRHEMTPRAWDYGDRSYNIGAVELWQLQVGNEIVVAHSDRVIPFQGVDLPDTIMAQDQGWGGSVFDLIWAELRNYQSTLDYLPEFVSLLTQAVFKQKGLAAGVLAGKAAQIAARYEVLVGGLSVLNALALDAETESYEVVQRPAAGLQEVADILVQALVAAGEDMPRVIMLGETPGGLHAGADSPEVRAYYDSVAAKQPEHYTEPAVQILDLMAHSKAGPTAGRAVDFELTWCPLYKLTAQENAALELTRSQRRQVDVQTCITPDEARRDPDVARLYNLSPNDVYQPTGGPAGAGVGDDAALDDADELLPVASADSSRIPPGEALMPIRKAARTLGKTVGAIMRDAMDDKYPIWKDGFGRWHVAMSLVRGATVPHVFPAANAAPTPVH